MKKVMFIIAIAIVSVVFMDCSKNNEQKIDVFPCACTEIAKTLENEEAIVRYNGILQCYTFELRNSYDELVRSDIIRPCNTNIPKSFQEDGLSVKISGDVFVECDSTSMPNARLFKYNTIKISNIERSSL